MAEEDPRMERLIDAVLASQEFARSPEYERLAAETLKMMGQDLVPPLRGDDVGGLFSPAAVETDKKPLIGALVLLPDRLVVAWRYGFTGGKKASATLIINQIQSVVSSRFTSGPRAGTQLLAISGAESIKLAIPPIVDLGLVVELRRRLGHEQPA